MVLKRSWGDIDKRKGEKSASACVMMNVTALVMK